MNFSDFSEIMELYSKPPSYKFNKEELSKIRTYLKTKKHKIKCKYAFYNKQSSKDKYIAFIIDSLSAICQAIDEHKSDKVLPLPVGLSNKQF